MTFKQQEPGCPAPALFLTVFYRVHRSCFKATEKEPPTKSRGHKKEAMVENLVIEST